MGNLAIRHHKQRLGQPPKAPHRPYTCKRTLACRMLCLLMSAVLFSGVLSLFPSLDSRAASDVTYWVMAIKFSDDPGAGTLEQLSIRKIWYIAETHTITGVYDEIDYELRTENNGGSGGAPNDILKDVRKFYFNGNDPSDSRYQSFQDGYVYYIPFTIRDADAKYIVGFEMASLATSESKKANGSNKDRVDIEYISFYKLSSNDSYYLSSNDFSDGNAIQSTGGEYYRDFFAMDLNSYTTPNLTADEIFGSYDYVYRRTYIEKNKNLPSDINTYLKDNKDSDDNTKFQGLKEVSAENNRQSFSAISSSHDYTMFHTATCYGSSAGLERTNYILRLVTREGGDYLDNMRFTIYARKDNLEYVVGIVELDAAAAAQGKNTTAYGLYGGSVIDIPFQGIMQENISKITVSPMGASGKGWTPESISVVSTRDGSTRYNLNYSPQTPTVPGATTTSNPVIYNYSPGGSGVSFYVGGIVAWQQLQNSVNSVSFDSAQNGSASHELSLDQSDERKLTQIGGWTPNFRNTTTFTNFFALIQTSDLAGAGLNPDFSNYDSIKNSIYIDVTYKAKEDLSTSIDYRTSHTNGALAPAQRTMRFYPLEAEWTYLNERLKGDYYVPTSVFSRLFAQGQSDVFPFSLVNMETGTADDIISVKIGNRDMDTSWRVSSFSIYEGENAEPVITNAAEYTDRRSSITVNRDKDAEPSALRVRPDYQMQTLPSLYYAPNYPFTAVKGMTTAMNLVAPDMDNLEGYINDGSDPYRPYEPATLYSNTYMLCITPSALASTRTDSNMEIKLSYLDTNGTEQTVSYDLNSMLDDFYGNDGAFALPNYLLGTFEYRPQNMNREIRFPVELRNVGTFKSVTVSLSDINKTFQFESVSIYKVQNIDDQRLTYVNVWSDVVFYTYYYHYSDREAILGDLVAQVSRTTYLAGTSISKTLSFIDYGGSDYTEPGSDGGLTSIDRQMSYTDINRDLKLATARDAYEIHVNTGSISDAGSTNNFFFQLLFENGTSGVVLANEQIAGDGFRQGETSVFTIMTNQYYGQPKGIRVYTHSNTSADETANFDKLNIDSIEIIRMSGQGLSTSWVVDNVGWIDINYSDDNVSGETTRLNSGNDSSTLSTSICKEYVITKSTLAMEFMVEFETGAGSTTNPNLTATVLYRKTNGATNMAIINLNQAINEFNETEGSTYVAGKMSRFYMTLSDPAEIYQIKVESDSESEYFLKDLKIFRVSGKGEVYIDPTDRFNRAGTLTPITYGPIDTVTAITYRSPGVINLAENMNMNVTFSIDTDGRTSFTTGATSQATMDESLNLYVFPGPGTTFREDLNAALQYTGTYSSGYMQKPFIFSIGDRLENGAMAYRGLNISNLGSISSITLSSAGNSMPSVSHVVIERVNTAGRKTATYYIDYANNYLVSPLKGYLADNDGWDEMKQTVTITTSNLSGLYLTKANDIGVSIRYRSSIDPTRIYTSDYVYLSEQAVTSLSKSNPARATLYERNVGEIIGVSIICTGRIELTADTVYACNYGASDELLYATGIASLPTITSENGSANNATYYDTTLQNPSTVMPVILTLNTSSDAALLTVSGTNSPVYATLICEDPNYSDREVRLYLGNIRDYFSSTNTDYADILQAGRSDTLTTYLYNAGTPKEIVFTMDAGDSDAWYPSSVSVRRKLSDGTFEIRSGIPEAGSYVSGNTGELRISLKAGSAEELLWAQQAAQNDTVSGGDADDSIVDNNVEAVE